MKSTEARTMSVLRVLLFAGALAAVMVLLREEGALTSKRVSLLDLDDQAFFDSSDSVANDGDMNMKKAGQNLKKGDLETALSFAKKAASEYGHSLSEDRLDAAEKVEKQVKAAIDAKKIANHEMIEGVLAEAQKAKDKAEAAAAREKSKLTAMPVEKSQKLRAISKVDAAPVQTKKQGETHDFNLATQAHLLYKDEKLLNVKAKTALAEAVKSAKAKLAALQKQFLAETTTTPADDATKPLPKVLDCGPLSNDCNTNQGGEFYAKHKGKAEEEGAGKEGGEAWQSEVHKGLSVVGAVGSYNPLNTVKDGVTSGVKWLSKQATTPKEAPPAADAPSLEKSAETKARTAKLALLKRVSKAHARQDVKELDKKGASYSGALQLLRDLSTGFLVPKARGARVSQALHEESPGGSSGGSSAREEARECEECFAEAWQPTAALACAQRLCPFGAEPQPAAQQEAQGQVSLAGATDDKTIAAQLKTAMARLDHEQLLLNNQRAAVFAEYVGPSQTSKRVQVQRFLQEWVPAGEEAMPSWLAASSSSAAAVGEEEEERSEPASPEEVERAVVKASAMRERGAGKEGLSLEQALDPLNEQQKMLNNERQELVHAFVKGGGEAGGKPKAFGDKKEYLRAHAAVLSWGRGEGARLAEEAEQQRAKQREEVQEKEKEEKAEVKAKEGKKEEEGKEKEEMKTQAVSKEGAGEERAVAAAKAPSWLAQGVPADGQVSKASEQKAARPHTVKPRAVASPTVASPPTVASKAAAAKPEEKEGVKQQQAAHVSPEAAPKAVVKEAKEAKGVEKSEVKKGPAEEAKGHHGMPQYAAKAAANDIESFFDDLVHKQIAVGHGVALHPWDVKAKPAKHVSKAERMREEEDAMIAHHDEAARQGAGLEAAEEQAKKGQLVTKVGNELRKKSDKAARDEIQDYFDSLGSS